MCRHLAYAGRPVRLGTLLTDPPHALAAQAWRPRMQTHGRVNADGFGVGWYVPGQAVPARHRASGPVWADETFADLTRVITAPAVLAAVRSATAGTAAGHTACAPFRSGPWLFSHNGALDGWPDAAGPLADGLTAGQLLALEARTDSALLWAAVLARLHRGAGLGPAVAEVARTAAAACGGRVNLLLTDGRGIAATRVGPSLFWRHLPGGVVVASEPYDDEPGWAEVPDNHLVVVDGDDVRLTALHPSQHPAPSTHTSPHHLEGISMPAAELIDHLPADFDDLALRADVRAGLTATPKQLSPRWLYDKAGSELFEDITRLPEYYPTRCERQILQRHAADIVRIAGPDVLIELGSGSSDKTRLLLDAITAGSMRRRRYVAVDVSAAALQDATGRLARAYPDLEVIPVRADFQTQLAALPGTGRRTVAFLGSTIGNLEPGARARFLADVRATLRPGEHLLLGADLVKSVGILVPAYDDAAGVTAQFNLNVLDVLNLRLGADFDRSDFGHVAAWDAGNEWIEMRLRARRAVHVRVAALDLDVRFAAGEYLRTEISAKFRREPLAEELALAGFAATGWWTDDQGLFSLSLWRAR
jgi:dimethylhistidine N-methyltransferase/ergothioneine biosynthesis protein EgtC